jgi:ABC-type sugar transport system ATPase subunit
MSELVSSTAVPHRLSVENVSKHFGSLVALRDVTLRVGVGEVVGLIGDNGAGKSTLIKVITGFHPPDSGRISLDGEEVQFRSVSEARRLGIETVFQDLGLVPELSIAHNMFLNREPTRWMPYRRLDTPRMQRLTREYMEDLGVKVPDVRAEVALLSGGQRQAVAIARAIYSSSPRVLLLDEPLAAMGAKEGTIILNLINRIRSERKISIILIAHNYSHVWEVCDRVNLLQHGHIALDRSTDEITVQDLTEIIASEYRTGLAAVNSKSGPAAANL